MNVDRRNRPTGVLARPDNQEVVLNYIRKHGKVAGAGDEIGVSQSTINNYIERDPSFKARVQLAKENFSRGEVDDLQQHWNFHAHEYNGKLIERLMELLMEGERYYEVKTTKVPKRDTYGDIIYDEFDEPVMEVKDQEETTFWKPSPKWVLELAESLMRNEHGKSDLSKIAPTIILKLVRYVKEHSEQIQGSALQELIGLAQEFDNQLKQEVYALRARSLN